MFSQLVFDSLESSLWAQTDINKMPQAFSFSKFTDFFLQTFQTANYNTIKIAKCVCAQFLGITQTFQSSRDQGMATV